MGKNTMKIIEECRVLQNAYKSGKLGQTIMPEDSNPGFSDNLKEIRLAYFTLPMALNYQRDSYKLWESALKTYKDPEAQNVFDINAVAIMPIDQLRTKLTKHKLALQPNKHIETWNRISCTIAQNWGSIEKMIFSANSDFIELKKLIQKDYKKGFPYLSGPKIFNYWSFIIQQYGGMRLDNSNLIDIAPDTHITKCSIKLGIISETEANNFTKEQISERWRSVLKGSGINPIEMHPPLWFWSRNGFQYEL